MENEIVKKLTSKNSSDFEPAALHIINNSDVEAFEALVEKSDFLFDFVKNNVIKRLSKVIDENNYQNLFKFLKIYSPDYEELIVSSFVKYADEDLTDFMLELLSSGTNEEKAYAAKYFCFVQDSLCLENIKNNCFSDFDPLAYNCAQALCAFNDKSMLEIAYNKLSCEDDIEILSAINFLIAYGDKNSIPKIFEIMKKSQISENIAAEIPYLESFSELLKKTEYKSDTLLAINYILNGFGDIIPLSQVFDFEFYEIFENLLQDNNSKSLTTLLNAKIRFSQLTENDEYLFDEDKNTKQEIKDISELLKDVPQINIELLKEELNENSDFVFITLQNIQELHLTDFIQQLITLVNSTSNQTLILKILEVAKELNRLQEFDIQKLLEKITNENIRAIIKAL